MDKISLSKGLVVLVDSIYYTSLLKYSWSYQKGKTNNTYYAQSNLPRKNGKRSKLKMHRLIMEWAGYNIQNKRVDHINGNGLDNRLKNLRIASLSQNSQNQNKRKSSKSGYKGVCWGVRDKKWRSYITVNGKFKSLGYYDSIEIAAKAYDKAALKYFGEFAKTNF